MEHNLSCNLLCCTGSTITPTDSIPSVSLTIVYVNLTWHTRQPMANDALQCSDYTSSMQRPILDICGSDQEQPKSASREVRGNLQTTLD